MATMTRSEAGSLRLSSEEVWNHIERSSFAVLGYATPAGEPRSSGVVYKSIGKRLFVAVAADSWKARFITGEGRVAVTIPVHRGGVLALAMPIPPATISFRARPIVHPAGSVDALEISKQLESLLPAERRAGAAVIELIPEGRFLTYGLDVSLPNMAKPELARAVVPIEG